MRGHGKITRLRRIERELVPLLPHVVSKTSSLLADGRSATVSGWLGLANGIPLSGQAVSVIAAPDDSQDEFTQAALTTAVLTAPGPPVLARAHRA